MNTNHSRCIAVTLGAAFAAALINLAAAPTAGATPEADPASTVPSLDPPPPDLDPFQDLFGTAGINSWSTTADTDLASLSPTLAGSFDTSVDSFDAANVDPYLKPASDPISLGLYSLDQGAFTADPALGGLPDNGIGDVTVGLDYTLYSADVELSQLGTLILELFGFGPFPI